MASRPGIFLKRRPADISILFRGDQNRYFQPNHDVFLTLTKYLIYVNLNGAKAKCRDLNKHRSVLTFEEDLDQYLQI